MGGGMRRPSVAQDRILRPHRQGPAARCVRVASSRIAGLGIYATGGGRLLPSIQPSDQWHRSKIGLRRIPKPVQQLAASAEPKASVFADGARPEPASPVTPASECALDKGSLRRYALSAAQSRLSSTTPR
jgi:hypothetical protein